MVRSGLNPSGGCALYMDAEELKASIVVQDASHQTESVKSSLLTGHN